MSQFAVLLLFLFVSANKTLARVTDNNPRTKAIISAMNNFRQMNGIRGSWVLLWICMILRLP